MSGFPSPRLVARDLRDNLAIDPLGGHATGGERLAPDIGQLGYTAARSVPLSPCPLSLREGRVRKAGYCL